MDNSYLGSRHHEFPSGRPRGKSIQTRQRLTKRQSKETTTKQRFFIHSLSDLKGPFREAL